MIRKAEKKDSSMLYDLLKEILEDMELDIFKKLPAEDLKELVVASMEEENYRYSYRNALVYEEDGNIAGCLFGYKGELEQQLDEPLQKKLVQYGLDPTISFFPDRETFAGEWYLDSIITHKNYRGKGIAKKLIAALPDIVKKDQEKVIGLNCDQDNPTARSVYEAVGFQKTSEMILSGHHYDHMQKTL